MPVLVDRVMTLTKPVTAVPYSVWVPLLGSLWVLTNVLLVLLGTHIAFPFTCSFLAGILDGALFSVIAVAKASVRLQAGTTGLLGGISLSGLRNDGSLLWKAAQGIHGFVDQALSALGTANNEQLHNQVEQEVLYIIWTTIFVVLASLIAEWIRASRSEA